MMKKSISIIVGLTLTTLMTFGLTTPEKQQKHSAQSNSGIIQYSHADTW